MVAENWQNKYQKKKRISMAKFLNKMITPQKHKCVNLRLGGSVGSTVVVVGGGGTVVGAGVVGGGVVG